MRVLLDALSPLKTRVARRVFATFVLCALGPLAAFSVAGTWHARRQVEQQAQTGLRIEARSTGQVVVEHLRMLEVELQVLEGRLAAERGLSAREVFDAALRDADILVDHVASLALFAADSGAVVASLGPAPGLLELEPGQRAHLARGGTLVTERRRPGRLPDVYLILDVGRGLRAQAELLTESLWASADTDAELVVLDAGRQVLFSSYVLGSDLGRLKEALLADESSGFFAWSPHDVDERAAYRQLFLEPMYGTTWTIVCSRPEEELFATVASFQRGILLTGLLTLWIVMYASLSVIRRRMVPIGLLQSATRRMASGDLTTRVHIATDDEFKDLAESFNEMAMNVRERTRQLEIAHRAKNEFLANMSHELRTPMTAILGYAEQCREEDVSDEEREHYLEIVSSNGQHLLHVINDILDVAKIEANRITVDRDWCSPEEILAEVAELLGPTAQEKGIALRTKASEDVPGLAWTDPMRLRQILLNLISNAIKFTEQGGVDVQISRRVRSGRSDLLQVVVRDTGIGMTPAQRSVVFKPFVQADTTTTRRYGGTGLGLSISRSFARLLGGDIECASEYGKGSTFLLTFEHAVPEDGAPPPPLAEPAPARSAHAPVTRVEGLAKEPRPQAPLPAARPASTRARVLIAEDVAVNRRLIVMILEKAGIEVAQAENGVEAVKLALAARDAGAPFDVVLMDMQMPVMDGYEATRRLRTEGYELPIVALTSHSMPTERNRCIDAGCDDFQSKPINRADLLAVIDRLRASA